MTQLPNIRVVAAVIENDNGLYLITQRRPHAALPLLWEFPGGRVEEGESDEQALRRELHHRLGVDVAIGELISFVNHPYEHYTVGLHLYAGRIVEGEPQRLAINDFKWLSSNEFDDVSFTPADESSMTKLLGLSTGGVED